MRVTSSADLILFDFSIVGLNSILQRVQILKLLVVQFFNHDLNLPKNQRTAMAHEYP